MQQLQFVELDEGGRLVLAGDDGTRYAVVPDDRLRAALRPRPMAGAPDESGGVAVSPRDVQAMIRAGQTAEEVAASVGWTIERVRRFEGPVLAEREHVVALTQRAHVRAQGRTDGTHTLDRRVRERLQGRGVEMTSVTWDASRSQAHGPWTVLVTFTAGGRVRRAAWHYTLQTRSLDALDDEARWLSEDEQSLPGGLAGHPLLGGHSEDEAAADLMATMRERRQRRGRRRITPKQVGPEDPSHVPGRQSMPEEVLPLEDLNYDPDTMGDPPAAHPRGQAAESRGSLAHQGEENQDGTAPEGQSPEQGPRQPSDQTAETDPAGGASERSEGEVEEEAASHEPEAPDSGDHAPTKLRRERRRLRIPRLPTAVAEPEPEPEPIEPEGAFARIQHDPNEVSFEEFFGSDLIDDHAAEEPDGEPAVADDLDEETADDEPVDEPAPEVVETELGVVESDTVEPSGTGEGTGTGHRHETGEDPGSGEDSGTPEPMATQPESPSRKGRTSVPSWDDIMFGARGRR